MQQGGSGPLLVEQIRRPQSVCRQFAHLSCTGRGDIGRNVVDLLTPFPLGGDKALPYMIPPLP